MYFLISGLKGFNKIPSANRGCRVPEPGCVRIFKCSTHCTIHVRHFFCVRQEHHKSRGCSPHRFAPTPLQTWGTTHKADVVDLPIEFTCYTRSLVVLSTFTIAQSSSIVLPGCFPHNIFTFFLLWQCWCSPSAPSYLTIVQTRIGYICIFYGLIVLSFSPLGVSHGLFWTWEPGGWKEEGWIKLKWQPIIPG